MSLFPTDDKGRKMLPIFKLVTGYFPKALREITKVCVANNVRYSPEREPADIVWNRGKSKDQFGSLFRHIAERVVDGHVFEVTPLAVAKETGIDRVYVLAEAAWRALAALELEIEAQEAVPQITSLKIGQAASGTATGPSELVRNVLGIAAGGRQYGEMGSATVHSQSEAPVIGCSCSMCDAVRNKAAIRT